jgi:DNA-binding MarR family transcriptional regulator
MIEIDRATLQELIDKIEVIAATLVKLNDANKKAPTLASDESVFSFGDYPHKASLKEHHNTASLVRTPKTMLPDPRLVRRIIANRQLREKYFDSDILADPAWDMLLDLTAARAEHVRVSVTSLCIASGVPVTTALRWIGQLVQAGLFERIDDDTDGRRAFIALSDKAAAAVARYFAELGVPSTKMV